MRETTATHRLGGVLLGWVALILPGALAIGVAIFRDVLPSSWLQFPASMPEAAARAIALALGLALLVVARGYFAFRPIGWAGYVAWALAGLIPLAQGGLPSDGRIVIRLYPLFVLLGLAYVWTRRREFGIGSDREAGAHP